MTVVMVMSLVWFCVNGQDCFNSLDHPGAGKQGPRGAGGRRRGGGRSKTGLGASWRSNSAKSRMLTFLHLCTHIRGINSRPDSAQTG